jgi:choline dehydrogenase-like flavoprotein
MAAHGLVQSGLGVLVLELGPWIEPGSSHRDWSVRWCNRAGYSRIPGYHVEGESRKRIGGFHCVGGTSLFYGGVALRMRERDLEGYESVAPGLRWPFGYEELAPYYDEAERLLDIRGDDASDPTAPPRGRPLPTPGCDMSPTSRALERAALRLGMHPFRIPLAIDRGRAPCESCCACDGFVCDLKNDLACAVLPRLVEAGLRVRPDTVARRLLTKGTRVTAVEAVDRLSGERLRFEADRFVLAAGALATPQLLLASGLNRKSPAGEAVGRYLMRHCNGIVLGGAPPAVGDPQDFRKEIGIHDFYFGDPEDPRQPERLGIIQQLQATRIALSIAPVPAAVRKALNPAASRLLGLIVMAEDQPRASNRVQLEPLRSDCFGRPRARIHHRHTKRDRAARRALMARAKQVLGEAHAAFTLAMPVTTFSHAMGTVRMGEHPRRFPVAPDGRFRGVDNLWITDASVFPTSAAVNPSLTIAANALRVAACMSDQRPVWEAPSGRSVHAAEPVPAAVA